ncbi:GNAT family N-acetyltransferase, partial [Millisia brevis]|uniref:GNAT family N-acetyltransferase n=1 Tax=Millisia brevis TaxID=264148 RepID=UPI001FDFF175
MAGDGDTATMPTRFLLDTNAFIALEPFDGQMEPGLGPAAAFMRLAMKQRNHVFAHPATRDELTEGADRTRAMQRIAELSKIEMLAETPISSHLNDILGHPIPNSNNHRDLRILAALHANAVNFLVTEDAGLHRWARRVELGDRALTLADAVALLETFEPLTVEPLPRVTSVESYALDLDQDIFTSIRGDYEGFDAWIAKVQSDSPNRECFIITEDPEAYAAIAILAINEPASHCSYDLPEPITKISTFKVAPSFTGHRYGELLLKAILRSHHNHGIGSAYVEVWGHHQPLIDLMGMFGYNDIGRSARGEVVLAKRYQPRDRALSPLDFHVAYGPPAVSDQASVFVIPIVERWHDQLFPECVPKSEQLMFPGLDGTTYPWGNALRKSYLCNAPTRQLKPGDAILFYRSGRQTVSVVGVVEETSRSSDAEEVLNMVGV